MLNEMGSKTWFILKVFLKLQDLKYFEMVSGCLETVTINK